MVRYMDFKTIKTIRNDKYNIGLKLRKPSFAILGAYNMRAGRNIQSTNKV